MRSHLTCSSFARDPVLSRLFGSFGLYNSTKFVDKFHAVNFFSSVPSAVHVCSHHTTLCCSGGDGFKVEAPRLDSLYNWAPWAGVNSSSLQGLLKVSGAGQTSSGGAILGCSLRKCDCCCTWWPDVKLCCCCGPLGSSCSPCPAC